MSCVVRHVSKCWLCSFGTGSDKASARNLEGVHHFQRDELNNMPQYSNLVIASKKANNLTRSVESCKIDRCTHLLFYE